MYLESQLVEATISPKWRINIPKSMSHILGDSCTASLFAPVNARYFRIHGQNYSFPGIQYNDAAFDAIEGLRQMQALLGVAKVKVQHTGAGIQRIPIPSTGRFREIFGLPGPISFFSITDHIYVLPGTREDSLQNILNGNFTPYLAD